MNPAFEKRYLAFFNSFERDVRQMTGDPFLSEGATSIREFALAETKRLKLNDLLRIDALYFLVLTLYDFVYRPAFTTPDTKSNMNLVLQAIQADITLLLNKAVELKRKQEISLKDLIQLINTHYDELKSLQIPNTPSTTVVSDYRRL
jgi:hypothetical protein